MRAVGRLFYTKAGRIVTKNFKTPWRPGEAGPLPEGAAERSEAGGVFFRNARGGFVRPVGTGMSSAAATASRIARIDAPPHTGHSPGSASNFVWQSSHSAT